MGPLLLLFLLILGGVMWYAIQQAQLRGDIERMAELERQIIRMALMRNGRITALDIHTRPPESVEVIEGCLRRLQRDGYCDSELTPEGHHIYIFRSFDDTPVRTKAIEKEILRLAKIFNGVVRPGTVALRTELTYSEARLWLEEMVQQRICQPHPELPDGYLFPEFALLQSQDSSPAQPVPSLTGSVPSAATSEEQAAESPYAEFPSGYQEAVDFIYDKAEESRIHQPRLPQKSGGQ